MAVKTPVIRELGARERGREKRSEPIREPTRPLRTLGERDAREKDLAPGQSQS